MLGIDSTVKFFESKSEAEDYARNELYGWYWWVEKARDPQNGWVIATPRGFLFRDGTIK